MAMHVQFRNCISTADGGTLEAWPMWELAPCTIALYCTVGDEQECDWGMIPKQS